MAKDKSHLAYFQFSSKIKKFLNTSWFLASIQSKKTTCHLICALFIFFRLNKCTDRKLFDLQNSRILLLIDIFCRRKHQWKWLIQSVFSNQNAEERGNGGIEEDANKQSIEWLDDEQLNRWTECENVNSDGSLVYDWWKIN